MKYMIEESDGLYCVYRWDYIGWRIVCAYDTEKQAVEAVKRFKGMEA